MSAKRVMVEYNRIHKDFTAAQNDFYEAKREYDRIHVELDRFLDQWNPVVVAYRDAPKAPPGRIARFFGVT